MEATEKSFVGFLEEKGKSFVIPIYQRNYDWKKEHCKKLFEDIVALGEEEEDGERHFLGTIVSFCDNKNDEKKVTIIDGQQRITTLSLLLLALRDSPKKDEKGKIDPNDLMDSLINKYSESEKESEKIKLKPVKNDSEAFEKLFEKEEKNVPDSKITNNYDYFKELIGDQALTHKEIHEAIKRLRIVNIKLTPSDGKPQVIFESLNSTGLSLDDSDLIRNFILMDINFEEQKRFYWGYWRKIEENTKENNDFHVDDFVRDFLTYRNRNIPKKKEVYIEFKKFSKKNYDEDTEGLLKELLKFSKYYEKIRLLKEDDVEIKDLLKKIKQLEVGVSYPFLLEVFYDYYDKEDLKKEDVIEILKTIESFVFRRLMCGLPTNSLNKIFSDLGKQIKDNISHKSNYVDILKRILIDKRGGQEFPKDQDFEDKIKTQDIYALKKTGKYLLQNLENYENKEKIDFNDNKISIEHVMPQKLTEKWKKDLGENSEAIHEKYLNRIGNLTLTGYNPEMKNRSFSEKRDMENGFKESRLFLNKFISQQKTWNEKEIKERAEIMIKRALKIWIYPETEYPSKLLKSKKSRNISDDEDFTNEKPSSYRFEGREIKVQSWREFYQKICSELYDKDPDGFKSFLTDNDFIGQKRKNIASDKTKLRRPLRISDTIYLEGNLSARDTINKIRLILKKFEIDEEELSFELQ